MSGRWLTFATLAACVLLVLFALWRRSQDTARIREFWGPNGARLIQYAPRVLLKLNPSQAHDEVPSLADERAWLELSTAPGLVHLRATLVDDRYFRWPSRAATVEELAARGLEYRVLRFSSREGFVDAAINVETGTVVNLASRRATGIIPSSRQAIAAYLKIQSREAR